MKRYSYTVIAVSLFILPFLATGHPSSKPDKGKKYPSCYRSNIIADGRAGEWQDSLFLLNPDAKVSYAMANDSGNLYLCLKVYDDSQQMKLLRGGMEVWIDPAGKKGESCGIRFPLSTTLNPGGKGGMHTNDPNAMKQAKLMFLLQAKDMELVGFRDGLNGLCNSMQNKTGVKAVLNLDSTNILICETKIPFSVFKTDVSRSNPLSVGFIIKGMERPKPQSGEDSHGGEMDNHEPGSGIGGGYGGQGGEGQHRHDGTGSQGGMAPQSRQAIFEDTPMWLKIVIAH
jgi:hypothetical protein